MGKLGTLVGAVILGLLGLSGCASSFAPLRPLEKGEIRHGFGLQLMNASLANYGLTYGALPYLETGFQVGLFNLGARARLHLPLGPASSLALSQSGLAFLFGDEDDWTRLRLRYEGKPAWPAFTRGFDYAAGPLFIYDWAQASEYSDFGSGPLLQDPRILRPVRRKFFKGLVNNCIHALQNPGKRRFLSWRENCSGKFHEKAYLLSTGVRSLRLWV